MGGSSVILGTHSDFAAARGAITGRKRVILFDDGNLEWRKAAEETAQSVGGTIVAPPPVIIPLNAKQLLELKILPREYAIKPILGTKGLMMVHAARGTGKTFFVLSLAYAIASGGSFLGWTVPIPRRVLVVDGEMAMEDLRERLAGIASGAEVDLADSDNLKFIASDYHEDGLPDLSTEEGQSALWSAFEEADVIIFDNLSTLFTGLRENENDDAQVANALFLRLRRCGKAVVIVHHSGKNGQQRGGSRKEDPLNAVIALRRPDDCDAENGCVFNVIFEKARGFYGKDAETFRADLVTFPDGSMRWNRVEIADATAERIAELKKEGMSQRDIAKEVGIGLGSVNRTIKRLKEEGRL